jgi:hypothetical protein
MPPIRGLRIHSTAAASKQPSTWEVISVLSGAAWFTYTIYSSTNQIWQWIQKKFEAQNQKTTSVQEGQMQKLHQRDDIHHSKVYPKDISYLIIVTEEMGTLWSWCECDILDTTDCEVDILTS